MKVLEKAIYARALPIYKVSSRYNPCRPYPYNPNNPDSIHSLVYAQAG